MQTRWNTSEGGPVFQASVGLRFCYFFGGNFDSGVRFSESARSISSSMRYGLRELGEKSWVGRKSWTELSLEGVWSSGGFRRVRSCVRIRKLLTEASGTLLASRLGRDKI